MILNYIKDYYKKSYSSGKREYKELFPTIKDVSTQLKMNQFEIVNYIKSLKNNTGGTEAVVYDYYKPIIEEIKEVSKIESKVSNNILFLILRISIAIAGFVLIAIGMKYNYYGVFYFLKDNLDSKLRAFAFMLLAIIFFEIWLYFWINKKNLSWFFLICYICITGYNSMTVLYYQYHKYQDMNLFSNENVENKKNDNRYNSIQKKIDSLDSEIIILQSQLKTAQETLSKLNDGDKNYWFYYNSINSRNPKNMGYILSIEQKTSERNNLIDQQDNIIDNTNVISNQKKELFLGKTLLLYILLPSVFIEFFASICFGLVLYLKF